MSSETMMNRTPETFGQARERERLEAIEAASEPVSVPPVTAEAANAPRTGRIEIPIPSVFGLPAPVIKADGHISTQPVKAAMTTKELYGTAQKAETPEQVGEEMAQHASWETEGGPAVEDWSSCDICRPGTPGHFCSEHVPNLPSSISEIDRILASSTASELAKFKKDVIAAFKHLGLDTRKHFGV